jgi:hypothetical protein
MGLNFENAAWDLGGPDLRDRVDRTHVFPAWFSLSRMVLTAASARSGNRLLIDCLLPVSDFRVRARSFCVKMTHRNAFCEGEEWHVSGRKYGWMGRRTGKGGGRSRLHSNVNTSTAPSPPILASLPTFDLVLHAELGGAAQLLDLPLAGEGTLDPVEGWVLGVARGVWGRGWRRGIQRSYAQLAWGRGGESSCAVRVETKAPRELVAKLWNLAQ